MLHKMTKYTLFAAFMYLPVTVCAIPVTISHSDSGWYRNNGSHASSNQNYIVGRYARRSYRNWFTFDLSGVTQNIASATLRLNTGSVSRSGIYSTYDVSTGIGALVAGGRHKTGIYNDLGTGSVFGSTSIRYNDDYKIIDIVLSGAAIASLNTASSVWAIGGTYDSSGYAFGYTHRGSPLRQLILDVQPVTDVPEPGMMALLGLGFVGMFGFNRRRMPC